MTTLAANSPRAYGSGGNRTHYPVIASDIIYEGAAVGLVPASGHAQPLTATDKFCGFAVQKADNSAGAAAAINVQVYKSGLIELTVTGVTITDVDQPVYATDDDTFTVSPVGGVFVGFVERWVSSGIAEVRFDVGRLRDPYEAYSVREAISGTKTLDSEDSGKLLWCTADITITLPAVATPALAKIVNGGAYGTVGVTISPNSSDSLEGPDITAADDKDVINTKATAQRGDSAVIGSVDSAGHTITELKGIWVREA